jgi:hypothetical protein
MRWLCMYGAGSGDWRPRKRASKAGARRNKVSAAPPPPARAPLSTIKTCIQFMHSDASLQRAPTNAMGRGPNPEKRGSAQCDRAALRLATTRRAKILEIER